MHHRRWRHLDLRYGAAVCHRCGGSGAQGTARDSSALESESRTRIASIATAVSLRTRIPRRPRARASLQNGHDGSAIRLGANAGVEAERQLDPFAYPGAFATAHDDDHAALARANVPPRSSRRAEADLRLVKGVALSGQRLGPIGRAYRVGLALVFGPKIAALETLGAIAQ